MALKRIRTGVSEGMDTRQSRIASLLNEAHNAIRLRHPNIVTVYDIGRVGNSFYISMEYLDGRTLYEEIRLSRDAGRVSPYYDDPHRWTGALFQAAHAVHYAHTRPVPIFHCDLKPGNVFITKDDRVCVLDFGLAHQVGELTDESGAIAGTPSYMAPEQVQGYSGGIDARTDVYGLGTILYELLAGQPPFTGEMADVLAKVLDEPPAPPGRIAQEGRVSRLSPEVEVFCLHCLEKDPLKRPQTALEFALDLEKLGGGGLAIPSSFEQPSSQLPAVRARPEPRAPGRKAVEWVVWLVLLAALGLGAAVLSGILGGPERDGLAAQAEVRLADFQPERARVLDQGLRARPGMEDLGRRLDAAEAFKGRLIKAVKARKPVIEALDVGGRGFKNAKVWKAGPQNVLFESEEVPDEASWSALGPAGIAALARACGLVEQAADRYGLAVYCAAAGAWGEARPLLESLRGTEFEAGSRVLLDGQKGK